MVAAAARRLPPVRRVDALLVVDDGPTIRARVDATDGRCPVCGEPAERVQSRATRPLADLPWAGALTKPHGPPSRRVASLLLRRPERRTNDERTYLRQLRAKDATIATAADLVADFLVMLRRREGERLSVWLDQAEASGIDGLKRFARTLRADFAAAQTGPTLRHRNGQTEGQVTKLKLVKRQGDGRAKVDLLRKRLLRAA